MPVKITCIEKSGGYHQDPHHAIQSLGWINQTTGATGQSTRLQMYQFLKSGGQAYVVDGMGNRAYLYPRENANGTQFVQTYADRVWTDNLLSLPECK